MKNQNRFFLIIFLAILFSGLSGCQSDDSTSGPDSSVPTVESTVPTESSTDVAVNSSLSVTFSEAMDITSVVANTADTNCSGTVQLSNDDFTTCVMMVDDSSSDLKISDTPSFAVSNSNKTFTFTPQSTLTGEASYELKLTTGIQDQSGNALASDNIVRFITDTDSDTTAPSVQGTSPADGATEAAVNSSIAVTFDKAMNSSTISANTTDSSCTGTIQVSADDFANCVRISANPSVNATNTVFTVTPDSDLQVNQTHKIKVTTAAEDLSGNSLTAAYVSVSGFDTVTSYSVGGSVSGLSGILVLQNNGGDNLTINADGSFTFASEIANGATYAITASSEPSSQNCVISNGNGTISNAAVTDISVACSNKSWSHPADLNDNISPDGSTSEFPEVAMDNAGNTIISWTQGDDPFYAAMSEYRNSSWTHPADVNDYFSPTNITQIDNIRPIAMDNNGNAVIVTWGNAGMATNYAFLSEYRNGSWTHPADENDYINVTASTINTPHAAVDNNGNAIVVWIQSDGANDQVFKAEFRNGSWTFPTGLTDNISPDGQAAAVPKVAMDNNGNATIVWYQTDGTFLRIFKSEYRGGSWTHPADLTDNISPAGQHALQPRVAMDDNDNTIIIWSQSDGSNTQAFKSEYRSGSWTHPASLTDNISPDSQNILDSGLQVAMDNNGNAIISWSQLDGTGYQIYKSEYRSGSWTHPADLTDNMNPDGQSISGSSRIAMDNNGNAIIVWNQYNGTEYQIFMSEYRSGSWTHPADLTDDISPNGQFTEQPSVTMSDSGDAVIVWYQPDGSNNQIFISEYR